MLSTAGNLLSTNGAVKPPGELPPSILDVGADGLHCVFDAFDKDLRGYAALCQLAASSKALRAAVVASPIMRGTGEKLDAEQRKLLGCDKGWVMWPSHIFPRAQALLGLWREADTLTPQWTLCLRVGAFRCRTSFSAGAAGLALAAPGGASEAMEIHSLQRRGLPIPSRLARHTMANTFPPSKKVADFPDGCFLKVEFKYDPVAFVSPGSRAVPGSGIALPGVYLAASLTCISLELNWGESSAMQDALIAAGVNMDAVGEYVLLTAPVAVAQAAGFSFDQPWKTVAASQRVPYSGVQVKKPPPQRFPTALTPEDKERRRAQKAAARANIARAVAECEKPEDADTKTGCTLPLKRKEPPAAAAAEAPEPAPEPAEAPEPDEPPEAAPPEPGPAAPGPLEAALDALLAARRSGHAWVGELLVQVFCSGRKQTEKQLTWAVSRGEKTVAHTREQLRALECAL